MESARSAVRELVAALTRAHHALEAGDQDAARQAVDQALALDPSNLAAQELLTKLSHIAASADEPAVSAVQPRLREQPPIHADLRNTAGWIGFEHRVRERRLARGFARLDEARTIGDQAAVQRELEELRLLAPRDPRVLVLFPTEITRPTEGTRSMESTRPTDGTRRAETTRPAASTRSMESTRPTKTTRPTDETPAVRTHVVERPPIERVPARVLPPVPLPPPPAPVSDPLPLRLADTSELELSDPPVDMPDLFSNVPFSHVPVAHPVRPTVARSHRRGALLIAAAVLLGVVLWSLPVPSPTPVLRSAVRSDPDVLAAPAELSPVQPPSPPEAAPESPHIDAILESPSTPVASTGESPTAPRSTAAIGVPDALTRPVPSSIAPAAVEEVSTRNEPAPLPDVSEPASAVAGNAAERELARSQPLTVDAPIAPPSAAAEASAVSPRPQPAQATQPPRDDEAGVRSVIDGYRRAYSELDAAAARRVWPSVNEGALARAFGQLRNQTVTFERCDLVVESEGATAQCDGRADWAPQVGDRTPRSERRSWRFDLVRDGEDWTISRVQVQR
jgi:hypothetical protein